MATDHGLDPIVFRLDRMAATPKGAQRPRRARSHGCTDAKRPDGRVLGISITRRSNSLGAGGESLTRRASGKIRGHKIWHAVDRGQIVQPAAGQILPTLHECVTIKDGSVEQSNFHDYNVMHMSDLPDEMHVAFVDVDSSLPALAKSVDHSSMRNLKRVLPTDRQVPASAAVHR